MKRVTWYWIIGIIITVIVLGILAFKFGNLGQTSFITSASSGGFSGNGGLV